MNIIDIIETRINKKHLDAEQIEFVVSQFQQNKISKEQMSAFLMTIVNFPLTKRELYTYTNALMNSGKKIKLTKHLNSMLIDKHSTGGIGDKISIILGPMLVSLGFNLAKLSGGALGKTGGTIDKLSCIPGFKHHLNFDEIQNCFNKAGMFIISQTKDYVPVEKSIYNLRHQTGSTNSISLIAASILSKKLIINSDLILIELTYGKGAFCETLVQAKQLSDAMVELCNLYHRKIQFHFIPMSIPIGNYIGNALELYEAYQFLNGEMDENNPIFTIIYELLFKQIRDRFPNLDDKGILDAIRQKINNKQALHSFKHWITAQNGDFNYIVNLKDKIKNIKYQHEVIYNGPEGYFGFKDIGILGKCSNELASHGETFDPYGGIKVEVKPNQVVKQGSKLFTLYSDKHSISQEIINKVNKSFIVEENMIDVEPFTNESIGN